MRQAWGEPIKGKKSRGRAAEERMGELGLKEQGAQDRQKWKRDHGHRPPTREQGVGEEDHAYGVFYARACFRPTLK